jgi:hypothetical protein
VFAAADGVLGEYVRGCLLRRVDANGTIAVARRILSALLSGAGSTP